jgi:hypothetical protein
MKAGVAGLLAARVPGLGELAGLDPASPEPGDEPKVLVR